MIQNIKNLLKYSLVNRSKTVVGLTLLTLVAVAEPVHAEEIKVNGRINFDTDKVDAEKILTEKYGKQQYETCDVSDVAGNSKSTKWKVPAQDESSIIIEKNMPSCQSVKYFVLTGDKYDSVHFQCEQTRFYNVKFAVSKSVMKQKGACEAIKEVFEAMNRTR